MAASLGIEWPRILWQIINFVILLFLLQRLLFKPILRLMDARAEKIRTSIDEAERMRQLTEEARKQNEASIAAARKEAQDLIAAATHAANQLAANEATRAREEADRIIARARDEIALERDRAIADVRRTAVDLAIQAAGKVIEQTLDDERHYQLVTDFMNKAEVGVVDGRN